MAIPTSNITMTHVKIELGLSADTPLSLTDSRVRALAGKPTGPIKLTDLAGKSSASLVLTASPTMAYDYTVGTGFRISTASANTTVTANPSAGTTFAWSVNPTLGAAPSLALSNNNRTATISINSRFDTSREGNLVCTATNGSLTSTITIPYNLVIEIESDGGGIDL